jgi:SOS-response transcriptional repressor LexA
MKRRREQQIRLQNLELLVHEAGSAAQLARLVQTNSSYLSQIRQRMPTPSGTPRGVGDQLAEKLERGMGKPEGWMDQPHTASTEDVTQRDEDNRIVETRGHSNLRSLHPLISWVQAGDWSALGKGRAMPQGTALIPCPIKCSVKSFVLHTQGASMEPKFHDGDMIFVDPKVEPAHGHYVIVRLKGATEAVLRQLIVEGNRRYLKALNPDWPERIVEITKTATICGVVVFKGEAM